MAFEDIEGSRQDGQPIELYTFVGSFNTYRFTSSDTSGDLVVNGNTFRAIVIDRGSIKFGTQDGNDFVMEVTLPIDEPLAHEYMFQVTPPKLSVTLQRYHTGHETDLVNLWVGDVTSFEVKDRQCTFKIPSLFSYILGAVIPTINYQTTCNHFLYDDMCQINRDNFKDECTVVSVTGRQIVLSGSSFEPNYCKAGEMVSSTGESRMITSHGDQDFTVNYPFANLKAGDTVEIFAGCNHLWKTCHDKFDNHRRFGGFPFVPRLNPFGRGL